MLGDDRGITKDMSSDSAKENASVVDSSLTEWKQEMGNADDPESPCCKNNGDVYPIRAQRVGHDWAGNSSISKKTKLQNARYFIIKSLNHENIQLSIQKGIWATQVMNEPILEEAFHNSAKVILIFSVNMSGFFQGYAQMMSTAGRMCDNIWSQGSGKGNPWGRSFRVKWIRLNDLPFQKTLHLRNPLNDNKPVKISRDCQELPEDIGQALCELIDGEGNFGGTMNSSVGDYSTSKRPFMEPPCSLGNGDYSVPLLHMPWARRPMPYPPFLYQHHAEPAEVASSRHSRMNGNLKNLQVNCEVPSRTDVWGLSTESPLGSTLTDDDLLEMTYEEYLEAHSRSIKQLNFPGAGPSLPSQESSRSKRHSGDSDSSFVQDKSRPRKRTKHSLEK